MESIIHIIEILAALAFYSIAGHLIQKQKSKLHKKAIETRYIIKINTDPVRYWCSGIQGDIKDAKDLRHWNAEIEVARKWGNYSELNYYMTTNNIPGEVMQYPTK